MNIFSVPWHGKNHHALHVYVKFKDFRFSSNDAKDNAIVAKSDEKYVYDSIIYTNICVKCGALV